MITPLLRRITTNVSLIIAYLIGLLYCRQDFLDFLISLFHFGDKVNLSSIAYIVQRVVFIIIPIIILTPKARTSNYLILKVLFYTVGICYIIGNVWVIYYLADNAFSAEAFANLWYGSFPVWLSNDKVQVAVDSLKDFQYNNAFVFNYIIWDSYNLFGVVFSFVMAALHFRFANRIEGHMKKVCNRYLAICLFALLAPILYNVLLQNVYVFSSLWGSKNALPIISSVFVYLALYLSSYSREFWNDLLM